MANPVPPPPPGFPGAVQGHVPPPPPLPPSFQPTQAPPPPAAATSSSAPQASKQSKKNSEPTPPTQPYDPAQVALVEASSDAPLPSNWSQHFTPQGLSFYWHALDGSSTWIRPGVALRPPQGSRIDPKTGKLVLPDPAALAAAAAAEAKKAEEEAAAKKPKKEKPRDKEPVEGTDWIRVTTTHDNVFFMNKATKTSVWTVPDELKEWEEARAKRVQEEAERQQKEQQEQEQQAQAAQKRKADDAAVSAEPEAPASAAADEQQQQQAEDKPKPPKRKKAKVVHSLAEMHQSDPELARQIAQELEAQREAADNPTVTEMQMQEQEEQRKQKEQEALMSSEESRALFKALLAERDINPMAPWDMELPKFIHDPRYQAVKQLRERRALFDEFCKDKIREQRSKRKDQPKQDPASAYRSLLVAEVTSTRHKWDEFRQSFKRDKRFREFGRDDREREKAFKGWLRELGELKRADAKLSEDKFNKMLSEALGSSDPAELRAWKDVREQFRDDPRFDAVKSGTRRQELYDSFVSKAKEQGTSLAAGGSSRGAESKEERQKRALASLAAREDAVKKQQAQAERNLQGAKAGANRQEAEREFKTLLIDAVRSHETQWRDVEETLSRDERFHLPGLSPALRSQIFEAHIDSLNSRRQGTLEATFERLTATEARRLDLRFADIWPKMETDMAVHHVNKSREEIRDMYEDWLDRRIHVQAKADLEECMRENSFVEYWGRLKRDQQAKEEKGIEDEDADDTEVVDVKQMSQKIDLQEMAAVLKHDKRFQLLEYDPALREKWMREFLETLTAPTQTVYQQAAATESSRRSKPYEAS